MNKINVKIKQCYDTEENYRVNNPVLLEGQLAYTKDKYGKYKVGDGISCWNDLDYTENIFTGTQKEYEEKNAAGEISPGTIVYITDDNDYCNINIDKELSVTSTNLIENQAVAKALEINETKNNTVVFDEADKKENINSGEKHSVIFGKIKKWFNSLKTIAFSGSYNDLEDKPDIPPEVAVKGDAESAYRQGNVNITAENTGALPLHGTADKSLGIINSFSQQPASMDINFSDPGFQNKITYMLATSSAVEGKPPQDAVVINLAWNNAKNGVQLAFGTGEDGTGRRMWMRGSDFNGNYNSWTEFINPDNASNLLYFKSTSKNDTGLDTADINTIGYANNTNSILGYNDGAIYKQVCSDKWAHEIYGDYRTGQIAVRGKNNGTWQVWRKILDSSNYTDLITNINNRLILNKGCYVSTQAGSAGTAGYVNFAQIKIKSAYANYPCVFLISGRGRALPTIVSVFYQSYDGLYPSLSGFYQTGFASYGIYINNNGGGVWNLYAQKNEAYGRIDILNEYISPGHFEVTHPGTQVESAGSGWIPASVSGEVNISHRVRDSGNNNEISLSINKAALAASAISWLACWNGYELRAVSRNSFLGAKYLNSFYGMALPDGTDNNWIRTTTQGIIPYQSGNAGAGHQYLGTSSWYFSHAYIDHYHGTDVSLTGPVSSSVTTSTHINGAKGTGVLVNSTAAAGYTMLSRIKSPNGVFNMGQYQGAWHVYYIADTLINGNTNSVTHDTVLLNEGGNSKFPGELTANVLKSTGHIYVGNSNKYGIGMYNSSNFVIGEPSGTNGGYTVISNDTKIARTLRFNKDFSSAVNNSNGIEIAAPDNFKITFRLLNSSSTNSIRMAFYTSDAKPYFEPNTNGSGCVGSSGNRWTQFYATNSSISTSDRKLKKEISYIGETSDYDTYMSQETLIKFIMGLRAVIYKRIDGESNRPHHGFIAQDIEELLQKSGIKDHAGFIKSPKTQTIEYEKEEEVEKEITNEETGEKEITRTIEKVKKTKEEIIPDEYIYSLRYEEFIADIVQFVQIQNNTINQQQTEINDLKARLERLEALVI